MHLISTRIYAESHETRNPHVYWLAMISSVFCVKSFFWMLSIVKIMQQNVSKVAFGWGYLNQGAQQIGFCPLTNPF
jgi:hypothetical protein